MYYVFISLAVIFILLIISGINIVPQSWAYVIERLGGYSKTWQVGFHIKLPFIDKVAKKVSLKETFYDYPPQPVITKDNVTMSVDSVVFFQVADPKLYTYGVVNPERAIAQLTTTTLRNVIGELELDETLISRDTINNKLRGILDEATDAWGIKVTRVEVKNIDPPDSIKDTMEKQMRAEREKRALILAAEGEKQSAILKAEGEKRAKILQAEAQRETEIQEAEGQAKAILSVQKATADGLEMIKTVIGKDGAILLKGYDALQKVADGKATKLIIPSELQKVAGTLAALKDILEK
ncbi:MAG: SPFH/Band 7/PHB domain protein [Deferribacteraceae bacterium]|jgi:regulator of protease activity HflC (stomatin/prohibitin superfamily)|nr:SPFH/Band 7/PHB domain protein [Deferribacteraceae bacterium]